MLQHYDHSKYLQTHFSKAVGQKQPALPHAGAYAAANLVVDVVATETYPIESSKPNGKGPRHNPPPPDTTLFARMINRSAIAAVKAAQ